MLPLLFACACFFVSVAGCACETERFVNTGANDGVCTTCGSFLDRTALKQALALKQSTTSVMTRGASVTTPPVPAAHSVPAAPSVPAASPVVAPSVSAVPPDTTAPSVPAAPPVVAPPLPAAPTSASGLSACLSEGDCWDQFFASFSVALGDEDRLRRQIVAASERYSHCNSTDFLGKCLLNAVTLLNEARSNYVVGLSPFLLDLEKVPCGSNAACVSVIAVVKSELQAKFKSFAQLCSTMACREVGWVDVV